MNDTTVTTDTSEIDGAIRAAESEQIEQIRRTTAIKILGTRKTLTLGKLSQACQSPDYGPLISSLTLADVLGVADEPSDPKPLKKTAPKTKAPVPSKKAAAPKTKAAAKGARQKFDRDEVYKKILGALKAAKEPLSRTEVARATGYNDDQTRSFLKELKKAGKVKASGAAAATRYAAA